MNTNAYNLYKVSQEIMYIGNSYVGGWCYIRSKEVKLDPREKKKSRSMYIVQ